MKKSLIILAVAFVLIGGLILITSRVATPWQPDTRLTFIGFTNMPARTNALFAVSNLPTEGETSWIVREISRKEGTNWKTWDHRSSISPVLDWYRPTPANFNPLAVIPVETITAPSRIVTELKLHPKGVARFFEDVRVRWAMFRGKNYETAWKGPSFFITNETVAVGAPPLQR